MLQFLRDWVTASPLTYLVVAAVSAGDAVLPVMPSETVVITAAVLASEGRLSLWLLFPAAAVGAFIGDNISFWLGDLIGEPVARKLFRSDKSKERLRSARRMIDMHGTKIILVARFIPGGRAATTFASGTLDFAYRRFLVADAMAAVLWAAFYVALGLFGGETFQQSIWKAVAVSLGIALLLAGAVEIYRRFQGSRGRDIMGDAKDEERAA